MNSQICEQKNCSLKKLSFSEDLTLAKAEEIKSNAKLAKAAAETNFKHYKSHEVGEFAKTR